MVDDLAAQFARHEAEILKERGALFKPLAAYAKDPDESPGVPFGLASLDRALIGRTQARLTTCLWVSVITAKLSFCSACCGRTAITRWSCSPPDEASEAVLFKLITIAHGIPFEQLVTMCQRTRRSALCKKRSRTCQ